MNEEHNISAPPDGLLQDASDALLALIAAYEGVSPPAVSFLRKWENKATSLLTKAVYSKATNPADRRRLAFLIARRHAMQAQASNVGSTAGSEQQNTAGTGSPARSLKSSCVMLTEGYMLISKGPANQRMTLIGHAGLEAAVAVDQVTVNVMSMETRRFSRRLLTKWTADNPADTPADRLTAQQQADDAFTQTIGIRRGEFTVLLNTLTEYFTREAARPTPNVLKKTREPAVDSPATVSPAARKTTKKTTRRRSTVTATADSAAVTLPLRGVRKTSLLSPAPASPPPPVVELPLRIQSVTLTSFRGAVTQTRLDFGVGRKGNAHLIVGDTGVGKTSIIQALEFALQDRAGKKPVIIDNYTGEGVLSTVAEIRNMMTDTLPQVEVELSDGNTITRSLVRLPSEDDGGERYRSHGPLVRPDFRVLPLALTRADLTRFFTNPQEREDLFLDYFLTSEEDESLLILWHDYVEAEKNLRAVTEELAEKMKLKKENATNGTWVEQIIPKLQDNKVTMRIAKAQRRTKRTPVNAPAEIRFLEAHDLWIMKHHELDNEYRQMKELQDGNSTSRTDKLAARRTAVQQAMAGIGEELTAAFTTVANLPQVEKIDVIVNENTIEPTGEEDAARFGSLLVEVNVHLVNGKIGTPETVLSERYSDIIALLLMLLVAVRAANSRDAARIIALDDVFSPMDSGLRKSLTDWMLATMGNWQLIITVHDRLWLMQLRQSLRNANMNFNEHELRQWDTLHGIQVRKEISTGRSSLLLLLDAGDPMMIAAGAGRLLEQASSELSWRLRVKMERKKEDRYSLGDLWFPVKTTLAAFHNDAVDKACSAVDTTYYLRNQLGAHHNDWTDSFSLEEAVQFGNNVLALYDTIYCASCSGWIERNNQGRVQCMCRKLSY